MSQDIRLYDFWGRGSERVCVLWRYALSAIVEWWRNGSCGRWRIASPEQIPREVEVEERGASFSVGSAGEAFTDCE